MKKTVSKCDNHTHTVTKSNTSPANIRKALAGLNYLNGDSAKKALTSAGFSPFTANTPRKNNLHAEPCIAAAVEVFPQVNPANLIEKTRRLMEKRLDRALEVGGKELDRIRLGEIARMVDVSEKVYGSHGDSIDDGRAYGERLAWLIQVSQIMKERGLTPERLESLSPPNEQGESKKHDDSHE